MRFDPAYHLRTNKQVERALFGDLLRRIVPHLGIAPDKYTYVGMGGPYLEDFVSVQAVMGCKKMTSLEKFPHVVRRQRFNMPHCRVDLKNRLTGWWVKRYRAGDVPMLVWLDYSTTDWKEQIGECVDLIPKLPAMSILKITLVCKASDLGNPAKDPLARRLEKLRSHFAGEFTEDDVRSENFHLTMKRIFTRAVAPVLGDSKDMTMRPLAAYCYSDGTPILTVTCLVGPANRLNLVIKRSRLASWGFATLDWNQAPVMVNIPDLGIRERLAIDRLLPDATPSQIIKRLKLSLAKDAAESEKIVESYSRFARHTPFFVKVAV